MTERKRAMCLRLSDAEADALASLSRDLGMPRASLIRQWIRAASAPPPGPIPDWQELRRQFHEVFGDRIRRIRSSR